MKKLIFRKFIFNVFVFFLTSILIMGLIVWTLQAVNYFDFVTQDGHGLKVYFLYTLLNFPKIINRILPFIFFISLFFTIIKYELNNELNIFWTNGISKIKFINKIIKFSFFIMFFQIFLSSYLSPLSQYKARDTIKNSNVDFFANLINDGKFLNIVSGLTMFIEKKNDSQFYNIFIDDSSKGFSRMTYAKNGRLINNNKIKKFLLSDGKVINFNKDKTYTFKFDNIVFDLENYSSNSIIIPKIQERDTKTLFYCIFNQIKKISENCMIEKESIDEVKQELSKRFFKPLYIPLIALICCFLLFAGKLSNKYNKYRIIIFMTVLIFIIISETSLRYSGQSSFLTILNGLLPLFFFLFFYIFFYLKINNV